MSESDISDGALYLRISHDPTGEGLGVARQDQDGRKLADARYVRIVDVSSDNDISASGPKKRPDFERLLKAIEDGHIKVVVAWGMTRLTRSARDFMRISELGQNVGLRNLLVNGPDIDFSNPMSRGFAEIASVFARMEIEQKGLRRQRANLQAAQQGRRVSGSRAFGYEEDGVTVRELGCPACPGQEGFTADRECVACGTEAINVPGSEAAAIERACDDALAGVGPMRIARDWNDQGFRRRRSGAPWDHRGVKQVLTNPRTAGLRAYRGECWARRSGRRSCLR